MTVAEDPRANSDTPIALVTVVTGNNAGSVNRELRKNMAEQINQGYWLVRANTDMEFGPSGRFCILTQLEYAHPSHS